MENNIELGSEFGLNLNELSHAENNLFSYFSNAETAWFNYGRTAIQQIPLPKTGKILLPEYICESVISCFPAERICFYRIDPEFNLVFEDLLQKITDDTALIYIAHYFGFCQDCNILLEIRSIADKLGIIVVEDTTQSFLSDIQMVGHYCVASVRKWLSVPQGGVLYAPKGTDLPETVHMLKSTDNRRAYGQILKDLFLKEQLDVNRKYREIFAEAEERADTACKSEKMSDLARFIISCTDIEYVINKRKHNGQYLENALREIGIEGIRSFGAGECPLVYPIRVNNRDKLRQFLIKHRIYCAVHWPFDGLKPEVRQQAVVNSQTLISLPIDQRYGIEELDYMIDVLRQFGGDLLF